METIYEYDGRSYELKTKEELHEALEKYKNVISNSKIEYLDYLIELEFSAIRDYISEDERRALSELNIYNDIVIYNICNRTLDTALDLFDDSNIYYNYNNGFEIHTLLDEQKKCPLFEFKYDTNDIDHRVKTRSICLHQTISSQKQKKAELKRLLDELKDLKEAKNPYSWISNRYGDPATNWNLNQKRKINECVLEIEKVGMKKELTSMDRREIRITDKFHKLLLDDFGLDKNDFVEEEGETELIKCRIKTIPSICIIDRTKYI